MQNRPPQNAFESEQAYLLLAFLAALLVIWLYFDQLVYLTSWVLYWLWMMVDFPQVHQWVAGKINLLASTANHAKDVTVMEWLEVMNLTSGILLLFMIPLVMLSSFGLAYHPKLAFRSKRLVNIHTLPSLVSSFAPSVIPVLVASGPDGLMNDTSKEHAWPLKPEEFAEQHNLVIRQVLDREEARVVFESQLGRQHDHLKNLAPHERALIAVFGAQVFLDDRKAATRLLDDLNRSCMVKGLLRRKVHNLTPTPIYSLADKLLARLDGAPGVNEWLETHGYVSTALAGLYGRDLRLPSARFRWLKGVDRTLWYALHSADTAKVYIEGSGVLAQARAEVEAKEKGLPSCGLLVTKAIDGLQLELESIGLVYPREMSAARRREAGRMSAIKALYSADASIGLEEA